MRKAMIKKQLAQAACTILAKKSVVMPLIAAATLASPLVSAAEEANPEPQTLSVTVYPSAFSNAFFDGENLNVPVVTTESDTGPYQNAVLQPDGENIWHLKSVREPEHLPHISHVGVNTIGTGPQQVVVSASGYFPNGCSRFGMSVRRYDEASQTFYVDLFGNSPDMSGGDIVCTAVATDYVIHQPLSVYGLAAGEYNVVVNDEYSGQFTLQNDNVHAALASSTVSHTLPEYVTLDEQQQLLVPVVDMPEQSGRYQQLELHQSGDASWELASLREGRLLQDIETVELLVETEDFPAQALLHVQGQYSNGCPALGPVTSRFHQETSTLEVNLYQYLPGEAENDAGICASGDESFDIVHPLPVFGVPAGTYPILINGEHTVTLTLPRDNDYYYVEEIEVTGDFIKNEGPEIEEIVVTGDFIPAQ